MYKNLSIKHNFSKMTQTKTYVGSNAYDYEEVKLSTEEEETFVLTGKTGNLWSCLFKSASGKEIKKPEELSGRYTSHQGLIRAVRDWAEKNNIPLSIRLVATNGDTLSINPKAL